MHSTFKRIFILLSLFTSLNNYSQNKASGKLIDQNNIPVKLAEIILFNSDSTKIKTQFTDESGLFSFLMEADTYTLQIIRNGSVAYNVKIDLTNDLDLGEIKINNAEKLEEVVIETKRKLITRKVDRIVFNVENSISASGGDALDALKVTPNVKVQNDEIKMIGKSNMIVMIDDKIIQLSGNDLTNFLKTIPSDNIKSIEVITTPPAKYDAGGNSGLINIKLKKVKKDSWNATLNTSYRQATYSAGNLGGNFNYQKDKISIFSSTNIAKGVSSPTETSNIYYPDQLWENKSNRKDHTNLIGGRIGIDYQINNKLVMGIQYLGGSSKPNIEEDNLTTIYDESNVIDSFIKTNAHNIRTNASNSFNYHTIYNIDTLGTKILTDVDYFKFNKAENRTFESDSLLSDNSVVPDAFFSANNRTKTNFSNLSVKIDVEMPLKWASFSYGGKISFSDNVSNVSFYDLTTGNAVFDPSQSDKFNYNENINALYFSGTKKIGKKWETQFGIRMESTRIKGISATLNQENTNSYIKFFPTMYITYNNNDNNSFSLSYSKRISRPSFNSLNPFRWYDNPYSYAEGNPFLQPSYSHNIEFGFTYNQNLENKIYYSRTINGFSQLTTLDENTNIQATKYVNFFDTEIYGISESYTYDKIKWWESVNTLDVSFNKSTSKVSITNQNREGLNSYLSTNNTFSLNSNKTINFNLNFWFSPSGVDGLDNISSSNQLDLALKFFFLNKNLQIGIVANDVFSSNRFTFTSYSNNIKQEYRNYYDIRSFRVSLVYKFGSNKVKVERRNFGNEDEKGRTN